MTACLGRIGCGLLLVILGAVGWHYRNEWVPKAKEIVGSVMPDGLAAGWQPLTDEGAKRALTRIQRLSGDTGPAYVNVSPADFASYVLGTGLTQLAGIDSAPEALVQDRTLFLRTRVRMDELSFGGGEGLGAVAQLFDETEPLMIGGQLEAVRPGLAQYRLTEVVLKDLKIPRPALLSLVKRWGPAKRPEGVDKDALPVILPGYIADLRVRDDRITLYKTVQ